MQDLCAQIAEIIEGYVEGLKLEENRYEESLVEIGMNSIAFIQAVVEMEERFQIEIPDEYLLVSNMDTVRKMASVILLLTGISEK